MQQTGKTQTYYFFCCIVVKVKDAKAEENKNFPQLREPHTKNQKHIVVINNKTPL